MTPPQLLETSTLLGLFVLLAGAYGLLYGLGRLHGRRELIAAGFTSYLLQCAVAAALLWRTPLLDGWKTFIGISSAAYLLLPPLVWRYLSALHAREHSP
ncbi:MAG TPA: hypothetical protein VF304_19615 [Casimicrobiaceae bacterium]